MERVKVSESVIILLYTMASSDPMIHWAIVAKSNIQRVPFLARVNARNRRIGFHWRHPPQSPNFPTNSLIYSEPDMLSRNGDSELTANVEPDRQRNFGHVATFYYATRNDKWYIISDIRSWNGSSRIWNYEDYKIRTHSFISFRSWNICADGKRGWPNQIPTVENDFRDIAKTFISLKIFFP